MYFFMLYVFGGTNCIKNLYTCTVEYFTGFFFQVYFNCDVLHSFTVMDIFIFVLDMQSLHCLKIFTFLCSYLVDLFFTVKKSIFNRYFLLSVILINFHTVISMFCFSLIRSEKFYLSYTQRIHLVVSDVPSLQYGTSIFCTHDQSTESPKSPSSPAKCFRSTPLHIYGERRGPKTFGQRRCEIRARLKNIDDVKTNIILHILVPKYNNFIVMDLSVP